MPGFDKQARARLTDALKAEAARLGFDACGVSEATRLDEEARRLEAWLNRGYQASMAWMARNFDKRVDPRELVPGAQSVVSVLYNYYQPTEHGPAQGPAAGDQVGKISRYAWGDDYHDVLKEKLFALFNWLDAEVGGLGGRVFVDSAPVLDKAWAQRSGLGWIGKHSNLLNRQLGSFFFIGEMIIDVPLVPDGPMPDYCGTCTRCLDACPTDAIPQPYVVDANRCISYWTIEHRGDDVPTDLWADFEGWIFGCDICQDVCPWNKFKHATQEPRFFPRAGVTDTTLREWAELDIEAWRARFRKNPVKRTKYEGFLRNVRLALDTYEPPPEDTEGLR
ncbi:MAG: tRNA epoxyqueuosine(34) reductase QueG [Bacteroidota bacterium]